MQDSLPAAGPALPGGIGYPQGSCERFHGCNDSPFPSFLARCRFIFSGKNDGLTLDFLDGWALSALDLGGPVARPEVFLWRTTENEPPTPGLGQSTKPTP